MSRKHAFVFLFIVSVLGSVPGAMADTIVTYNGIGLPTSITGLNVDGATYDVTITFDTSFDELYGAPYVPISTPIFWNDPLLADHTLLALQHFAQQFANEAPDSLYTLLLPYTSAPKINEKDQCWADQFTMDINADSTYTLTLTNQAQQRNLSTPQRNLPTGHTLTSNPSPNPLPSRSWN